MRACLYVSRSAWFLAALLLAPLAPGSLRAGEGGLASADWFIKNWSVDDGFPGNSAFTVSQTSDGYLWLSTQDRMTRFDGVRFVVMGSDDRGIMPLPGRRHERLWCRDSQGQLLLRERNSFRAIQLPAGANSPVQSASEDSDGTTWIGVGGDYYRWKGGQWASIGDVTAIPGGVGWVRDATANRYWCILTNQVGFFENGLFHKTWSPQGKEEGLPEALAPRREGGVWCVTLRGTTTAAVRTISTEGAAQLPTPIPWNGGVLLTDLLVDRRGDFWISASTHGALRLKSDGSWEVFDSSHGLGTDNVRNLFEDIEGNIWMPTDGNGLYRLTRRAFRTYGAADGLTTENVYAVAPSRDGGVWIGTHGARSEGFFRWREGQIAVDLRMGPYAWSVHEDPAGDAWAGTFECGLFRLHQGTAALVPGSPPNVFAICDDGEGGLWIGGIGLGRVREGRAGPVEGFPADIKISSLTRDLSGTLWIGTRGKGLYAMRDGKFERFSSADGLASDDVLCLYTDTLDILWIGTSRGLSRRWAGRFSRVTRADGLASDTVSGLAEDRLGHFWLHSPEGISRISRKGLGDFLAGRARNISGSSYGREDGLVTRASTTGSQPRVCRDRDGRMWFATLRGVAVIDPASMPVNTNQPPVVLEEVVVNSVVQNEGWSTPDLRGRTSGKTSAKIDHAGRTQFPAGSRGFEIHYTANTLTAPEKSRFRYRLSGVHSDWVEAGGQRQAVFDRLSPGHYRFEVTACNNDGVWNEHGTAFAFAVLPFFWQTLWFRSATAVTALLIVLGLVRRMATRQIRRQLVLAEQRIAVERERSRISQDMHDDLGARLTKISLLGELAGRSLGQAGEAHAHLKKLSAMARETAGSLSELIWTVKPANDTLRSLATHLCQHADEYLRETELRCRLDVPEQLPDQPISAEVRQQIVLAVQEAITNVVKHARATELRLGLLVEKSVFSITISDDGQGFSIGSRMSPGSGNGLPNLRERLLKLGGKTEIVSQVGHGTRVKLTVPFPMSRD